MTNPVISLDATKRWYDENGKYHREDGPALIFADGSKWWCRNGKFHREDGPAIITLYGGEHWFVNGEYIDIKPILERLDIPPDWQSWSDEEKFLMRLALP